MIEAVTDDVRLKTRILKQLDPLLRRDAIVASTTSSISITRLASETAFPERFIGMHFFSPLTWTALVEIVRGLRTSDNTHDVIDTLSLKLGKIPITVKNRPGFIVNRILTPMLNEAFFVLAEGDATPTEIDEGLKLGCNHPVGPLALADIIGLDVVLSVIQSIHRESGDRNTARPHSLARWSPPISSDRNPAEAFTDIEFRRRASRQREPAGIASMK